MTTAGWPIINTCRSTAFSIGSPIQSLLIGSSSSPFSIQHIQSFWEVCAPASILRYHLIDLLPSFCITLHYIHVRCSGVSNLNVFFICGSLFLSSKGIAVHCAGYYYRIMNTIRMNRVPDKLEPTARFRII